MRCASLIPSIVILVSFVSTQLIAQPAKDAPQKKDPQQSIEPKAGPGEGQKFLSKFVGDWKVVKKFYPRNGGEPSILTGTCRQEMVHEGRFLRSEFEFESVNGKSTGTGVIGFEVDTGLFTSSWFDSRQTKMSFRKSKAKFNGDKIELYSCSLAGETEVRQSKTVTTLEKNGTTIVHKQVATANDGSERLIMELVMTRVFTRQK